MGPFLFVFDPDSPESAVDNSIAQKLQLFRPRGGGSQRSTEADNKLPVALALMPKFKMGTFAYYRPSGAGGNTGDGMVRLITDNTFVENGRRVHGIIGRDIIADSLIYRIDRDRGMLYISTAGHMTIPEGAQVINYTQNFSSKYGQFRRYLAKVQINDSHTTTLHLDLGGRHSTLRESISQKFGLPKVPMTAVLKDEYGTPKQVSAAYVAKSVKSGPVSASGLLMLPYSDKRIEEEELDGTLGMSFWKDYHLVVNWHKKRFYVSPRDEDPLTQAETRLSRWGDALSNCEHPGCVEIKIHGAPSDTPSDAQPSTSAPNPANASADEPAAESATAESATAESATAESATEVPQGTLAQTMTLEVMRESTVTHLGYDVTIGAVDDQGKLLKVPALVFSFKQGKVRLKTPALPAEYFAAEGFRVLDVTPVGTLGCQDSRCVHQIPAI